MHDLQLCQYSLPLIPSELSLQSPLTVVIQQCLYPLLHDRYLKVSRRKGGEEGGRENREVDRKGKEGGRIGGREVGRTYGHLEQ